ncbi:phage tail spike protein [Bulleidia sp. zg-1006]|uniref:phage tail spike protein n=1 Tax=Bulleidia sp. zg-1006 TaxID=2806552 RepID=UPI001939C6AE|nr:phage tail spike protein [Bulleidia sp. zg-1006]QRG86368.1 phage tail protein [Bulleidia sp. zg-1006]
MKPILYETTEMQFNTNGIGTLADAISCIVEEERNGLYELEMEYPLGGIHYNEIQNNKIIMALPSDGKRLQPFRIYKVSRPVSGIVTIYAQHISYDLAGIPVAPFKASDCASALIGLKNNSMILNPFEVWTDISGTGKYNQKVPATFRSRLAGVEGSILDSFGKGAELEFDRFTVKVHQNRGTDNGVTIRYGKNLIDLKQEESIDAVYTGVLAYWSKEENDKHEIVIGDIQYLDNHADYLKERIYVLECSSDFEKKPTKEQVNNKSKQYLKNNKLGVPKVTLDVSFIQLWQTEEYKNIVSLERVNLCDTVHVIFDKLGVNATAKVIKTEYDVLSERYTKVTLGDAKSSFAQTVKESTKSSIQPLIKSAVDVAVNNATSNITNLSGYVTKITDADGNWTELVISDHPDYKQAKNIWRWTQGGLGFSSNGYAGPYETAITADGQINANAITTGTLDASLIRIGNKTFTETLTELRSNDSDLKTQLEQTAEAISQTVTKKEFDGTMSSITNKFDDKGLHIKRKINGEDSKKEALLNDDELRFTRADGTDAIRINEHESYFGKWVTIANHRFETHPIHEWDIESVGGVNKDSQTISGTGLFYSGDSEGN